MESSQTLPGTLRVNQVHSTGTLFLSAFFYAGAGVQIKMLAAQAPAAGPLPYLEVAWVRFLVGCLCMLSLGMLGRMAFRTQRLGGLLCRGLFGTVSVALYFYAIAYGRLSVASLLTYSSSIFAVLFSALWLREWPARHATAALSVAIAGLVVLTNPEIDGIDMPTLAGLGSAVSGGIALTAVRDLRKTESATLIYFSLCCCGFLATGACLLLAGLGLVPLQAPRWPLLQETPWLLGAALAGTVGQVLMTWGMGHVSTFVSAIIGLSTVPMATAAAILCFGEKLEWHMLAGGLMVLGAAIYLSVSEPRRNSASALPAE